MGGGRIFSDRVEPGAPGRTASWPTPHPPTRKIKQSEAEGLSDRPNLIVCSAFADVRVVRNRLRRACQEAFAGPVRSSSVCSAFTPCEISASSAPAPTRAIGLCARPILLRLASLNFSPSACASPRAPASATSFGPQGLPPPQPGPQESHVLEPRISHHRRGHRTVPPV